MPVSLSIGVIKDSQGRVTGSYGIAQDITERRRLEQQLRQAQKMEAVGQLAGGVAHDFNNLLMVIMGYAGDLAEHLGSNDPLRGKAEEIGKAGQRAASLTRQLLAFSRQQVLEPKVLNLNSVVEDVRKMLGRLINEDIELITALDPELGRAKADQGQIEQVIVNLAVNARDAMPLGGTLTIKTANVKVNETFARQHLPMSPGSFIGLTVTDTGIGMDAETQSHVFEPFFTTKERGKGTGLGLATVYGVVKQSGGFIWVSSELGKGTTFEIFFPRVSESAKAIVQDTGTSGTWTGTETILLVEDDEALRNMVLNSLSEAGYMVLAAANGAEALRITRERSGNIDLLLTDVVMPGMSGTRAADSIVALCPDVKVIYMSGYSDFAAGHDEILKEGRRFLQKPYKLQDLARAVREALDSNLVPALPLH
jgi:nitrogen-specific signal transduction histidine kinase/ActR/RegA family two-component response regulator